MEYPEDLRYTEDHEWLRRDGDRITIGITDHAQKALGDIVFVELPSVGAKVSKGDNLATVESVKAVGDVFAPLDGAVAEVNSELESAPQQINEEPYGKGWIVVLEASDPSAVENALTASAYREIVGES
jgi:glycine cleavage system H protein